MVGFPLTLSPKLLNLSKLLKPLILNPTLQAAGFPNCTCADIVDVSAVAMKSEGIIEDLARARGCVLSVASVAQPRDWSNRAALGDQLRGRVPPLLTDFLAPKKYRLSQCPMSFGCHPQTLMVGVS